MAGGAAAHGHHQRQPSSFAGPELGQGAPIIEMVPNLDFSFPARPQVAASSQAPTPAANRRPASMHANSPPILNVPIAHRRSASTLPGFSFNASDTSGLKEDLVPTLMPDQPALVTPSKRGHKRGGSEFVGGDSRFGVSGAISSSPTKATALPLPVPSSGPPPGRRGHAHRRSAAMSNHDVSDMVKPSDDKQRQSNSLPNIPLEHPFPQEQPHLDKAASDPSSEFAPDMTSEPADSTSISPPDAVEPRPPSRPRVGFSDNIEYIPRPLSTISSETESSMSTIRGHSVNNSISSVLSLSTPSPPSARYLRTSLSTAPEDEYEPKPKARSSLEISKRIEKEGEWFRSSTSSSNTKRPLSEPAVSKATLSFAVPETHGKQSNVHGKKHSLSHAFGFDRRKSEPAISVNTEHAARLSALSLQEASNRPEKGSVEDRASSTKRLTNWAISRISKKSRDLKRPSSAGKSTDETSHSPMTSDDLVPGKVLISPPPSAETDLDAVFGGLVDFGDTYTQPLVQSNTPTPSYTSSFGSRELDDASPVLDLDAALGPFKSPNVNTPKPKRETMHSSRPNKDFTGPFAYYHRRSESAPELIAIPMSGMVSQTSLPDVFEGDDEEEEEGAKQSSGPSKLTEDDNNMGSVGIEVVDSDHPAQDSTLDFDGGLVIQEDEWELQNPTVPYSNASSRLSTPIVERRPSSIIEETIPEEMSPTEGVEIVEAHEEPRASSLTKSSDSSETPTILASQAAGLGLPHGTQSLTTPETYQTSTFSSPDFRQRQGSFDMSRLGTSVSSIADNRTMSSYAGEPLRVSVDDVPSLTSSRSTMISTMHANISRRDFNSGDRTPSEASGTLDSTVAAERRRKRSSIQSLSQLVGSSFSGKIKGSNQPRPQTANDSILGKTPKKEHRLKKLMFWRSKSRQSITSNS